MGHCSNRGWTVEDFDMAAEQFRNLAQPVCSFNLQLSVGFLHGRSRGGSEAGRIYWIPGFWFSEVTDHQRVTLVDDKHE